MTSSRTEYCCQFTTIFEGVKHSYWVKKERISQARVWARNVALKSVVLTGVECVYEETDHYEEE